MANLKICIFLQYIFTTKLKHVHNFMLLLLVLFTIKSLTARVLPGQGRTPKSEVLIFLLEHDFLTGWMPFLSAKLIHQRTERRHFLILL